MIDYAPGFTGPHELEIFTVFFFGNLFILIILVGLGIMLWRNKE